MNIKESLLEDKTQNKTKAIAVAEYACSSPEYFKELMQCFLSNDYRLAQRAAWSVSRACKKETRDGYTVYKKPYCAITPQECTCCRNKKQYKGFAGYGYTPNLSRGINECLFFVDRKAGNSGSYKSILLNHFI